MAKRDLHTRQGSCIRGPWTLALRQVPIVSRPVLPAAYGSIFFGAPKLLGGSWGANDNKSSISGLRICDESIQKLLPPFTVCSRLSFYHQLNLAHHAHTHTHTHTPKMSRSIAPSRTLLKNLQGLSAPTQPCRRFLSSAQSSTSKRPVSPRSIEFQPRHQPLTQKRFKYKSVEEAKSQYRVGVGTLVFRVDAQFQCAGSKHQTANIDPV